MSNTTNTLSPELKAQIENEAIAITAKFKDNNDYQAGYRQGVEDGYESGATPYALKWQQAEEENTRLLKVVNSSLTTSETAIEKLGKAEEMMERVEREIQNAWESRVNGQMTEHSSIRLIEIARLYNHYKKAKQ